MSTVLKRASRAPRDDPNHRIARHTRGYRPVILIDTGPLVALFDPKDALHERCKIIA